MYDRNDELNKTPFHQANPRVHQQHVVLATTFRSGLPQPLSSQIKSFDLIKAGATQSETSLLKQHVAGERVDLLDDYDFPARTIIETRRFSFSQCSLISPARSLLSLQKVGRLITLA